MTPLQDVVSLSPGTDTRGRSPVRLTCLAAALALSLLLAACPRPDRLPSVESSTLATADIALSVSLRDDEGGAKIVLTVDTYASSDGIDVTAGVDLSPSDRLEVSVDSPGAPAPNVIPRSSFTRFEFDRASLVLPATFRVQLIRDGEREDARDTFVTLSAVFETIRPREGDVLPADGTAVFAWALRDGDGNAVGDVVNGAEAVKGVWSEQRVEPRPIPLPREHVLFAANAPGPDGFSREGALPSLALVPAELRGRGVTSWDLDVSVSAMDVNVVPPATFDIDPALLNGRTDALFQGQAVSRPKAVPITIR